MRKRNRSNNNMKKERAIMVASSVFVLSALTLTGIYVKQYSKKSQNDGYSIDFSALDNDTQKQKESLPDNEFGNLAGLEDDLDYFPPLEETGSDLIQIPGLTNMQGIPSTTRPKTSNTADTDAEAGNTKKNVAAEEDLADQAAMEEDAGINQEALPQEAAVVEETPSLSFSAGDSLVWPVSGNVLINFSMDKSVYFATLQQYKRNPSIVISATEGDVISAAASGKVISVYSNEEIGNAVKMDIGSGYQVVYGQLKDIQVSEGQYVEAGAVIGYVAQPTKYYSVEGCNVYFALTKDNEPVNPLGQLE